MVYCPECKSELKPDAEDCPICGHELESDLVSDKGWSVIGSIDDKISADFAIEALRTYDIPAVAISRSGFFGNAGLPLNPFYASRGAGFEISVPDSFHPEAMEILKMIAGDRYHPKET